MRIWFRTTTAVAFAALAAWLTLSIPNTVQAQAPAGAKGKGGGKGFAQDSRAQTRRYHFEDTNEDLPYSLYVSSKVKKDQKVPLVVTLHGLSNRFRWDPYSAATSRRSSRRSPMEPRTDNARRRTPAWKSARPSGMHSRWYPPDLDPHCQDSAWPPKVCAPTCPVSHRRSRGRPRSCS